MRMMNAAYGKKVILLIDEYDVPLAKASERDTAKNGYYSGMLDVIKGIMSTALKDNEFLKLAVITGCLRIGKESIFTGTNNFALNYLSALKKRRDARPKNYWKNTSHNGILLTFVKRTDFDVAGKFEKLLNGGSIVQTITDELTYDSLHSSEDNLWSVLLMTGYITKADPDENDETVSLKIPNKEIASIFQDSVVRYFTDTVNTDTIENLIGSMWEKDEERSGEIISGLLWDTISYNDYHEDYYHAFLAGVFVGRGYEVESNKEKGLGRPDILLKDRKKRRAIIIETKKSVKETDMEKDCDKAIEQIRDEKYADGLYGYDQILCYGIAFFQKQAKVKLAA